MTQYGKAAVEAAKTLSNPEYAWDQACNTLCGTQSSSEKPCPRSVFLGLCEEGFVKGVSQTHNFVWDDTSLINKHRGIALRNIIFQNNPPSFPIGSNDYIWAQATIRFNSNVDNNNHSNTQLDVKPDQGGVGVVRELFDNNLLC